MSLFRFGIGIKKIKILETNQRSSEKLRFHADQS